MRYKSVHELPEILRALLPNEKAQGIYLEAYNETWDTFSQDEDGEQQSRDAEAHRDGWAAVKREFVHDQDRGVWYRKGEKPQEEKAAGFRDKLKGLVMQVRTLNYSR